MKRYDKPQPAHMTNPALPVVKAGPSGASKRGSHQLASIFQCPRKWYLRYRQGIREAKDKKFRIGGTLHHDAIAYAYAERIIEQGKWPTPSWWTGEALDDILARHGEGWPVQVAFAREMYHAYRNYWWYGSVPEPWEPVAVEEQFVATIGEIDPIDVDDPFADQIVTCGTDLVVRNTLTNQLWICDHKSKGFDPFNRSRTKRMEPWVRKSTGGGDHEQYAVHWQALVNLYLVRRAFPDEVVAGFIINRFTREKTPEGKFLFDRHPLHVSPRVYERAPSVLRYAVMQESRLDGIVAAGGQPEPHYWACHGKYGSCDYIGLCNADDEDAMNRVLTSQFVMV